METQQANSSKDRGIIIAPVLYSAQAVDTSDFNIEKLMHSFLVSSFFSGASKPWLLLTKSAGNSSGIPPNLVAVH